MWRSIYPLTHKSSVLQTHKCSILKTHKYGVLQLHERGVLHSHKCGVRQTHRCSVLKTQKCSILQTHKYIVPQTDLSDRLQTLAEAAEVPPTLICSDFSLDSIARLRPDAPDALKRCGGLSDVFISQHGQARPSLPCSSTISSDRIPIGKGLMSPGHLCGTACSLTDNP